MSDPRIDYIDNIYPMLSDWGDWEHQNPEYAAWVNAQSPETTAVLRRLSITNPLPRPGLSIGVEPVGGYPGAYDPSSNKITHQSSSLDALRNVGDIQGHISASSGLLIPLLNQQHELTHAVQYGPSGLQLPVDVLNEDWGAAPSDNIKEYFNPNDMGNLYDELPMLEDSFLPFTIAQKKWDRDKKLYEAALKSGGWVSRAAPLANKSEKLEEILTTRTPEMYRAVKQNPGTNNWTEAIEKEARFFELRADILQQIAKLSRNKLKFLVPAAAAVMGMGLQNSGDTSGNT